MSEEAPAIVGIAALAIDCTDPRGLAYWWSRLLGGSIDVDPQGDVVTLHTPAGLAIDFLRVPEPKTGKNRLHLDVRSHDFATAIAQALALGATRADDIYAGGRWQVLRDPEGNEFCILRPRAQRTAEVQPWAAPASWRFETELRRSVATVRLTDSPTK